MVRQFYLGTFGQGAGGAGLATFVRALRRAPVQLVDTLLTWQMRANERHHLAALDDHVLRDMGLGRADALREAEKPFWRA